jgi:hypothetical protein
MRSVILQHNKYHYECLGIGVQYILDNSKEMTGIDIYISFPDEPFGVAWIELLKKAFPTIDIQQIKGFSNKPYDIYFLASSFEVSHLNTVFFSRLTKKPLRVVGIAHYRKDAKPWTISLTPCIPRPLAALPNYGKHLMEYFPNDFFPEIEYFSTGNPCHLNVAGFTSFIDSHSIPFLFLSRAFPFKKTKNIVFCLKTSVENLIKCFLYKKGIMFPKSNCIYEKEQGSGLIHLAYSFQTRLYAPLRIKSIYNSHENIIGFLKYDDILELEKPHADILTLC